MAIELKVPTVGESITEVQIGQWLKAEGDTVRKDEAVVVIESEKATLELPAPETGKLTKILRKSGETVPVGTLIAQMEKGDAIAAKPSAPEAASRPRSTKDEAAPGRRNKPVAAAPAETAFVAAEGNGKEKASPKESSGKEEAPASPPPPPACAAKVESTPAKPTTSTAREEEVVPMSMLRRTVARRLVEAQQTMAMVTTFNEVDMSGVQALRRQHQEDFQKRYGIKLGLMSFFVKAAIAGLKEFPQVNAEVRGNDIVYRNFFDIGVAIAAPRGLVVPVLTNAERLSFAEVESRIADFALRSKEGKLKPNELEGGTFTITNGGTFGSLLSTPAINPPQSGILGLHSIVERPIAHESNVVIRPMMYVALTYDHRIVDGREAVLFLRRVREVIENPARMLLEI